MNKNIKKISNILKDLQKIKTIDGNIKEKKEICDYVENIFKNTQYFIERFNNDGIYSIVISSKQSKNTDFLFSGHLDVVDADEETWKYGEDEEYFYGRGTLDMKGADACMILSFLENEDKICSSDKNFALMFTTDEELGGEKGVEYLIKEEGYTGKMIYIPDTGAGMDKYLKIGKGFLFGNFIIKGIEAHGCRPWKGKSSLDTFIKFYDDLYKEFPKVNNDEDGWENISLNIGKIKGGKAVNQVMENLKIEFDIRFHPKNTLKEIIFKINKVLSKYDNITFQEVFNFSGFKIDENSKYINKYLNIIENKFGKKIKDEREYGSNDGRFFVYCTNDIIMTGPFGYGYHGKNEKVSKKELENFKIIFDDFINELI